MKKQFLIVLAIGLIVLSGYMVAALGVIPVTNLTRRQTRMEQIKAVSGLIALRQRNRWICVRQITTRSAVIMARHMLTNARHVVVAK
jgi:hypothetical protein